MDLYWLKPTEKQDKNSLIKENVMLVDTLDMFQYYRSSEVLYSRDVKLLEIRTVFEREYVFSSYRNHHQQ
jgi:hypothetical protein